MIGSILDHQILRILIVYHFLAAWLVIYWSWWNKYLTMLHHCWSFDSTHTMGLTSITTYWNRRPCHLLMSIIQTLLIVCLRCEPVFTKALPNSKCSSNRVWFAFNNRIEIADFIIIRNRCTLGKQNIYITKTSHFGVFFI